MGVVVDMENDSKTHFTHPDGKRIDAVVRFTRNRRKELTREALVDSTTVGPLYPSNTSSLTAQPSVPQTPI